MSGRKSLILIIDDDKSILRIFARILQKRGHGTDCAETAQEALGKLQTRAYDLALTDVKLPDMSGIDLLAIMNEARPDMAIIAITGFPSSEEEANALDRGAAAYLVKPVKTDELLQVVTEKLARRAGLSSARSRSERWPCAGRKDLGR